MAEHEDLIARLNLIAQDAAKLDSRARQEVLDATLSCSARLLGQPSPDQSHALNEPQVQLIPHLPLQTDDMDTSPVTEPPERDGFPDDHEIPTGDHCAADFGQQSTEILPSSFLPQYEPKTPNQGTMATYFDQQHIQNTHYQDVEMSTPFDWSTSFPNHSSSMPGTVALGSINDSYQMLDLTDEINNTLAPHPTFGLWNNSNPITLFGPSTETTTVSSNMADDLTIDLFNGNHNSFYQDVMVPIPEHSVPTAIDQLDSEFDHLNSPFTTPIAHLDLDSCIFQEPAGVDTLLRGQESPTPRTFQRPAFHGRVTTPESHLATTTHDTVPGFVGSGASFDCDLTLDQQQRLCGELRARNVRPLPGRLDPRKMVKAIRKKRALFPEERRQIAETRRIGACFLCNRDRKKCSDSGGPCSYCMKTVGSLLASHICLKGLQIHCSKFDPKIVFKFFQRQRCTSVDQLWHGIVENLELWELEVEHFNGPIVARLCVADQHHIASYELDLFNGNIVGAYVDSPSEKLEDSIDDFFLVYCGISPYLPMRNCVMAVMEFVTCKVFGPSQQRAMKMKRFEKELLGILDENMSCGSDRHFQDPMILGLCIRRLSLHYRHQLICCRAFMITGSKARKGKWITNMGSFMLEFQEKSRSMYNGCISAYSKVYHKGKSPYSLNWRLQDHMKEFGSDTGLAEMFEQIRTKERIFCEGLDKNDEDDKVYRELFLNTKQRGEKSWSE